MSTYVYPRVAIGTSGAGLATEIKQDDQIVLLGTIDTSASNIDTSTANIDTSTASIDTKTPSLGQAAMAASTPIVVASDQTSIPVKLRDASDVAINLGQAAMAASVPVVLSSNQSAVPVTSTTVTVVDQIDTTPLLDVSVSNIPASSANSLQLVASLAADVRKIITVEDIGEFFGLYSGPVATPTLLCILPLGGGEVDVVIPSGSLVSIRHMKDSAVTSGYFSINFIG